MVSSKEFYQEFCKTPLLCHEDGWKLGKRNLCFSWESGLMNRFAKELFLDGGTILEIGFGQGVFSQAIHKLGNMKHIILEPHPEVYKKAIDWSSEKPNVQVVNCLWQDFIYNECDINSIMYDGYSEKNKRNSDLEALFVVSSKKWLASSASLGFFYADPVFDKDIEASIEKYFGVFSLHKCFDVSPNDFFLKRGIKDFMYVPITSFPFF
jgi:hypothetical protein